MTYIFTRDVDDLSGGPRRAGGAGQPRSILASLALEDAGVSVPAATRRPRGTIPAPTFSPGLPLSPLGPCKGKGAGVSSDGDGAGSSASVPRGRWARGRAGGTLLPAGRGSPPGRGGRPRRARQRPPGRSTGTG